jgi:hypothetical protein
MAYLVDGEVSTINGESGLYKICEVHDAIEKNRLDRRVRRALENFGLRLPRRPQLNWRTECPRIEVSGLHRPSKSQIESNA